MPTLDEAIAFILTFLRERKEMAPGRPTPAGSV
jgi:hypothetical protein